MSSDVVVRFKGDSKDLERSIFTVRGAINGLGTAAMYGVGLLAGGLTAFGVSSVKAFEKFDENMNQSLAIMGDVSDVMKGKMKDAAMDIGNTMRISSTDAAGAFYYLASAGLSAEQSVAALKTTAQFAQAGMFDLEKATDLLMSAQSSLGLKVDDATQNMINMTRVSDVLVKANVLSQGSVEDFADALNNKAAGAMRNIGMELEEGVAVLAAFAEQGTKGQVAGTQFSIVLRDLQTQAYKNTQTFEKMGIQVFDSKGEFKNFADILGDIEKKTKGMSDLEKKGMFMELGFTDKSLGTLLTLIGTSDRIREFQKGLEDASGTAAEISDKQMDSYQAKIDAIKNKWENLQIEMGEDIAPVVLTILTGISDWWEENGDEVIAKGKELWDNFNTGKDDFIQGAQIVRWEWDSFYERFRKGAGVMAEFFGNPKYQDFAKGLDIIGEHLEPLQERFRRGAEKLANFFGNPTVGDFRRGVEIIDDKVRELIDRFIRGKDKVTGFFSGLKDWFGAAPGNGGSGIGSGLFGNIPFFAQGAYVSQPTLAVVGDSLGEGEFVAPESKLKAAVHDALLDASGSMGGAGNNAPLIGVMNLYGPQSPQQIVDALAFAKSARRI